LRREHFNRWYSSGSYYLALSLSDYPVLIIFSLIYNVLAYFMTNQPLEQERFVLVIVIGFILCFSAQAYGLFAGSMFGLTVSMNNT
jgi:ABC-2 type transporter